MHEQLFSYGTLQLKKVQLESFGRILSGSKDSLRGYKLSTLEIKNKDVLTKSDQQFHPIAIKTGNSDDIIDGMLFDISLEELAQADAYEVEDYKRILEMFESGNKGWIYVKA